MGGSSSEEDEDNSSDGHENRVKAVKQKLGGQVSCGTTQAIRPTHTLNFHLISLKMPEASTVRQKGASWGVTCNFISGPIRGVFLQNQP